MAHSHYDTRTPQWRKHLREWKKIYWHKVRQTQKKIAQREKNST
jgi:hypothetical protein